MRATKLYTQDLPWLELHYIKSPAAGPQGCDRDSVASLTMAVRGPFSSYPHGDQGRGTGTIPLIATFVVTQSYAICSITTQRLINTRKFTSWNCFD